MIHVQQTYQVLDEIDHIRKRSGIYVGSTVTQTSEEWIVNKTTKLMEKKELTYIPALIKIFSEILDNAIDEGKRNPHVLDTIKVSIDGDSIIVQDNGTGIPVKIHPTTNQYVAETVFSNLRAGSNFNDNEDQALIGTNGLGSTLCVILSQHFKVESCDGVKLFRQEYWNGMRERSIPKISKNINSGTKITFSPDYDFFNISGLNISYYEKIYKKVVDAAACNLNINFYFNNTLIKIREFEDYIKMYSNEYISDSTSDWNIGVTYSDGFEQISFINSVETYQGGTHVDYVTNQIISKLRDYFKKKHKLEVKPAEIRSHIRIFISANINRPKFSSQTKENLVSPASEWKTTWTISDKFIRNLIKSDIIAAILDWVKIKENAQLQSDLRKLNKSIDKNNPKKVEKFYDATTKCRTDASLLICEGDSALSGILSGRDPKIIAAFPLRGKPLNVTPMAIKDVLENKEFKNIMTITGLQVGVKILSATDIRFGKIVICTDQDLDGFAIRGLLLNAFHTFWPELFALNIICILNTPIIKAFCKDKVIPFYTIEKFNAWKLKNIKECRIKYYKGLGTSTSKEWKEYFQSLTKNLDVISIPNNSTDIFTLQFSKKQGMSDKRKLWLDIEQ